MNWFRKKEIVTRSYAKINLSLKVVGKNEDGYHELEMVNLPIELHDIITVDLEEHSPSTYTICDDVALSNHRHNLCTKAIEALREQCGFKDNFLVDIHKEIPFAAGLGGGSSNAAVVIKTINELIGLKLSEEKMREIGLKIGADVPYFFNPKPAKVTGIGEIVEPISVKSKYFCLVIKPEHGLSTKEVFSICDNFPRVEINTDAVIAALASGDDELLAKSIGNDLYAPACTLLPEVKTIVDSLKSMKLPISGMTGSGSACFALSQDQKIVKDAFKYFDKLGYDVRLSKVLV